QPARHRRRRDRRRQSGLRAADRPLPGAPDLPPDDPAGPLVARSTPVSSLDVAPAPDERLSEQILSDDALAFVAELHERFGARRLELLRARAEREPPRDFLPETREIREGDWQVPPPRPDYADRRVEITGPTDRKLVINALNSGARGFMADFEDANSHTWRNQVSGQANLIDAIEGTISYTDHRGRDYQLAEETATLIMRPRGWHLQERHLR